MCCQKPDYKPKGGGWAKTGFQFMANKQFRMEIKRLGTSVCADISQHAFKNQYVQFYMNKSFF